ncbi:acyl-CoA dehydrogenase family protein [Actinomadura darangshiensis]|nr:acyl-CoA dehydrogenase [Actinomadura darangshiensis]
MTPTAPPSAADLVDEAFQVEVRGALAAFTGDFARWELERHIPKSVPAALGRAGLFRRRWEPGAEGGLRRLVTMCQEICRESSGLALVAMGHSEIFVGGLHWLAATPYQLELLENALDGAVVGCFGATEPHGGSSLGDLRTAAVRVPDGWRLTGCKRYISNVGRADYILVLARAEDAAHPGDLSLFLLPLDHPGVTVDGFFDTAGLRSCDAGQVTFDATLPDDALLGKAGLGLLYATHLLHFERLGICAQLITAADTALRLAAAYTRQRTTGGRRVMDRQSVRHRLARARAELWNLETRLAHLVGIAEREGRMPGHEIAALKLTAGESTGAIVDTALQLFGARGYTAAFPLERIWRDARLARLGGGTDEVMSDLVAARVDRADPYYDDLVTALSLNDQPGPVPGPRG